MPEAESTFRPVGDRDVRMPGKTALLIAGFAVEDQLQLRALLDGNGLAEITCVYVVASVLDETLFDLARLPSESHAGEVAKLPRVLVMSGLTERQLHLLMKVYRESSLPHPSWASVTPTTEQWTIKQLLIELLKEREAMRQARAAEA